MNEDREHSVYFGNDEAGSYLAASIDVPYFCFQGASTEEVRIKAEKALAFYFESHLYVETRPSAAKILARFATSQVKRLPVKRVAA